MTKFSTKRSKRVFVSVSNRSELLAAFKDALNSYYNDTNNTVVKFSRWYRILNVFQSIAYKAEYTIFLDSTELRDSLDAHMSLYKKGLGSGSYITVEELKIYIRKEIISEVFTEE